MPLGLPYPGSRAHLRAHSHQPGSSFFLVSQEDTGALSAGLPTTLLTPFQPSSTELVSTHVQNKHLATPHAGLSPAIISHCF